MAERDRSRPDDDPAPSQDFGAGPAGRSPLGSEVFDGDHPAAGLAEDEADALAISEVRAYRAARG